MKVFIDNEDLIDCVRETVDDMFGKVLKRRKPKRVRIVTGDRDDYSFGGMFIRKCSSEDEYCIKLNYDLIWKKQNHEYLFRGVFVHELTHAADLFILQKDSFYKSVVINTPNQSIKQLKWPLWMLDHCRAEGIADLGTRLLWLKEGMRPRSRADFQVLRCRARKDARFNIEADAEGFAQLMERVMDAGEELPKGLFEEMRDKAYDYGSSVMLRVLRNLGLISQADEQQICTCLRINGRHLLEVAGELSLFPEEECKLDEKLIGRVLNACLLVNLPMYLEGLLLGRAGKPMVSLTQLLALCGDAQRCRQDDRIALFAELVNAPQNTVAGFNKAMRVLAGKPMKEVSLTRHMHEIQGDDPGWPTYFGFIDKINRLYTLYQEYTAAGRKELARAANHALHYFFRTRDLIADFLPAFGFVDDLLVIDTALDLLANEPH